jgi:eukaryotic-like serine/threonine-protein kinase
MTHKLSRENCHPKNNQKFVVKGIEYSLGGEIGDGAVGLVRRATRVDNNAQCAVKFLAPDPKYIDDEVFDDVALRFKREGERGTKLAHPNLIKIQAYCENADGECFETKRPKNPFLLMEYIQGRTLESYIRRTTEVEKGVFFISRQRLNIAIQIANALDDLHRSRLVHRDIKPANIFLSHWSNEGFPVTKLGDFGVMKWGDFHASLSTGSLTVTSQRGLGTMKYMSPELAIAPRDVTVRSDVYSLGITFIELFSGQILASAHHVYEIMNARLSRGTTQSRYLSMGYNISGDDDSIAELLLDMFLKVSGRPTIEKIKGRLEREYERRFDTDWQEDAP